MATRKQSRKPVTNVKDRKLQEELIERENGSLDEDQPRGAQYAEKGTPGLQMYSGFIREAYNEKLFWPQVAKEYNRIWRSMPEMIMTRFGFTTWGRHSEFMIDLPADATDDDKRYQEFFYQVLDDAEGGPSQLIETMVSRTPFFGFLFFEVVPGRRDDTWTAPQGDEWRSQYDDGLIGIRRFAYRDYSSFAGWDVDEEFQRVRGFKQYRFPRFTPVTLPISGGLHLTNGDPHNPEGFAGLEPVWRLERLKYGFEVVQGIGFEHAAGYLNVEKLEEGAAGKADLAMIRLAARSIMTAQEGNYAAIPFGWKAELKDVNFTAAPALLATIKHYSILSLAVFMMQFIALNTMTDTGALASATDTSSMGVLSFNGLLDGLAAQFDNQIGRRLYDWNKAAFPGLTARPKVRLKHIEKELALTELGGFLRSLDGVMPMDEEDWKAIRARSGFLPKEVPQMTPEEIAEQKAAAAERRRGQQIEDQRAALMMMSRAGRHANR